MKPSFATDIISFMGVALGAAAGLALTAAIVTRSHDSRHDVHFDSNHFISVAVGHDVKHNKVMAGDEVFISELIEAEIEAEQARLEGERIRLRVEPRMRIERREREERRR